MINLEKHIEEISTCLFNWFPKSKDGMKKYPYYRFEEIQNNEIPVNDNCNEEEMQFDLIVFQPYSNECDYEQGLEDNKENVNKLRREMKTIVKLLTKYYGYQVGRSFNNYEKLRATYKTFKGGKTEDCEIAVRGRITLKVCVKDDCCKESMLDLSCLTMANLPVENWKTRVR